MGSNPSKCLFLSSFSFSILRLCVLHTQRPHGSVYPTNFSTKCRAFFTYFSFYILRLSVLPRGSVTMLIFPQKMHSCVAWVEPSLILAELAKSYNGEAA